MKQTKDMLQEMAETYRKKITADASLVVQFEIHPAGERWYIAVSEGNHVELGEGIHPGAFFVLTMSDETLAKIYRGELAAFTATARANISDPAPLDILLPEGAGFTQSLYLQAITFIQRFFWHSDPECILLGEAHARMVHGAHAIPLFYHPGFRSAWYLVKKGERLNEPGDVNPFPQGFVFVSGQGMVEIGGKRIAIRAGEAYYIPPGISHVVWTDSDTPLSLLWLAWGDGA